MVSKCVVRGGLALSVLISSGARAGQALSSDDLLPLLNRGFRITGNHADVLAPLASLCKYFPNDRPAADRAESVLVENLNAGVDPDPIRKLVAGRKHIGKSIVNDPSWPYCYDGDVLPLAKVLFAKARSLRDKDPAAARSYARASVLFPATYGGITGTVAVQVVSQEPDFSTLAGFDGSFAADVQNWFAAWHKDDSERLNRLIQMLDKMDLVRGAKIVEQKDVDAVLEAGDRFLDAARDRPDMIDELADYIWQFRTIVKQNGSPAELQTVETRLAVWSSSVSGAVEKRLLKEVLDTSGTPRQTPFVNRIQAK